MPHRAIEAEIQSISCKPRNRTPNQIDDDTADDKVSPDGKGTLDFSNKATDITYQPQQQKYANESHCTLRPETTHVL